MRRTRSSPRQTNSQLVCRFPQQARTRANSRGRQRASATPRGRAGGLRQSLQKKEERSRLYGLMDPLRRSSSISRTTYVAITRKRRSSTPRTSMTDPAPLEARTSLLTRKARIRLINGLTPSGSPRTWSNPFLLPPSFLSPPILERLLERNGDRSARPFRNACFYLPTHHSSITPLCSTSPSPHRWRQRAKRR